MKKILFFAMAIVATTFVSCNNKPAADVDVFEECDSIVEVDSIAPDSLVVDTIVADTAVIL